MLYIIGLGLNIRGISNEGLDAVSKCDIVYLENYTVEFPYSISDLEKVIGKKIIGVGREQVESDEIVKKAKRENIALLIYGSPLFATTHISLLMSCKKAKIKTKIIYNASIFDAIAETGLELYKFGKISSMPKWDIQKHFTPDSFLEYVEENNKINSHSLILIDIELKFKDALEELEIACKNKKDGKNNKLLLDKLVVCSNMGSDKSKIFYGKIKDLKKKKVSAPFCFIIPAKMHFIEEESLKNI